MATDASFMEYVAEQAGLDRRLRYQKMFGEYGLYVDDKVVALACDNSLYLKPLPPVMALVPRAPLRPPYPGAKPHVVADEYLDDADLLRRLLETCARELPAPKAKKTKPKNKGMKP
jgi:TfoX/Sxy family transcriptional regulator of competence genes